MFLNAHLLAVLLTAPLTSSLVCPRGTPRAVGPPIGGPFCNLTSTSDNPALASLNFPTTSRSSQNNGTASAPLCPFQTIYPSELRHMNSLYPNHQFEPTKFFMVLRESNDSFQVGTHIQFQDLPPNTKGKNCSLILQLPGPEGTDIRGLSPSMNIYQVARGPGVNASWATSIFAEKGININAGNANITGAAPANVSRDAVGTVNGDPEAVERVRRNGGTVVVGEVRCNRTLTFHAGMARPGTGPRVNYWDFLDVPPGAVPNQGWRVLWRPEEC